MQGMEQVLGFLSETGKWLDAHDGFCMVLLTFALVVTAFSSCVIAVHNTKTIRQIEQERTRPFLVLAPEAYGSLWHVSLSNAGLTPAYDIEVEATPKFECCFLTDNEEPIRFLNERMPFLHPGGKWEQVLGSADKVKAINPGAKYEGEIRYKDAFGKRYAEKFIADYSIYPDLTAITPKTIHDIGIALEGIKSSLEKLAGSVAKQR